jgi:hypothetical protein
MYSTASWSHSVAMDGYWAARLAQGVAWTFACKTLRTRSLPNMAANSSESILLTAVSMGAGAESAERRILHQDMPSWPRGHMLSQRCLVNVGTDPFAGENH